MPKDSLNDALFALKGPDRRSNGDDRRSSGNTRPRPPQRRGRPKAFDSFYLFAQILLGLALILQALAFLTYA